MIGVDYVECVCYSAAIYISIDVPELSPIKWVRNIIIFEEYVSLFINNASSG